MKNTILAGSVLFVFTVINIFSYYPSVANAPVDCIVVFGAAVWPGDFGPVASHALKDRTLGAVELYKKGLANCIVLSGAESVYGAHEVDIMTDILLENDIPLDIVELDREGVNTLATIENLDKNRSYIFVSNDFHLARINLLAKRTGLSENDFSLYPAKYITAGRYQREWYFTLREVVAIWYYFWYKSI